MDLVGLKKCFLFLISVKGHCMALLFLKLNIHHDYRYINISHEGNLIFALQLYP